MERFTADVHKQLGHYVYRLIDPRDGSTFYVGRGQGNRVFSHVRGVLQEGDEKNDGQRLALIRKIRGLGLEPMHVIHRHGMSEQEARLVEAALIDVFPGLTNKASGEGSKRYGPATASQLAERYGAEEIEFDRDHKIMMIKVKWLTVENKGSVYEAVRASWRISKKKANQAEFVLAIIEEICRGVYKPEEWHDASDRRGRYAFRGREAPADISKMYLGKRLPARFRKKGSRAPVLYEGC